MIFILARRERREEDSTRLAEITSRPCRRPGCDHIKARCALRFPRALRSPAQGWPARARPVGRPAGRDRHPGVDTPGGRRSLTALAGQSGSITVVHDGKFGALSGKAIGLEPATGFTFDTPLLPRPR